ncbi:TIGR02444 family protein [Halomonas sp. PAMB 3264]|uniref:TIGR02444 family protein n=1 Tax=Halomonas sp. PAMB 3264 TaxID=3075222 RepID=UPI002898A7A8|nr:TIGR02444 family protein [Halomonas sp. PAMB 3264]WNL42460.1 TIGR02444 family protein [Halomonas sp. PAMB 3264]
MSDSNRSRRLRQTPLWDFACAFYALDDVTPACLTLQDQAGVDVCELLFHAWLYRHGLMANPAALAHERRSRLRWQHEITQPLRALRQTLKGQAQRSASIKALRDTIKHAELAAEKENLDAWQAFALAPQSDISTLEEIDKESRNASVWLQYQLFSSDLAADAPVFDKPCIEVENAWAVIGTRLDPVKSAR